MVNLSANAVLIPGWGINGAAAASTISYSLTAVLMVGLYTRLAGQSVRQTLVMRRSDVTRLRSLFVSGLVRVRSFGSGEA